MAVIATLTFGTFQGHQTQWELDILDSDYSGTPVALTGTDDPFIVTWHKDREVYKPILGSSAEINLWIKDAVAEAALPDFNDGNERQYEVRLRYRDMNGDMQPFWCGYIDPVASSEQFTTYPYEISFNCVDGLGRLEELTLDRDTFITSNDPSAEIPVLSYVTRTLRQTGLELPVYIESGFRTGSNTDALTTVSASAYSFFGEDISDRRDSITYKDALEKTLATFNCRVFQSGGAWWVINCSTHGGTGNTETATFSKYIPNTGNTTDYTADGTQSFDLRKSMNSQDNSDVTLIDEDLQLSTRRRVGSYEARPSGLIQKPLHQNDDFRKLDNGWTNTGVLSPWSGGLPSGYMTNGNFTFANESLSDENNAGQAWSMVTNRNRQVINSGDELWIQSTNGFPTNQGSPTNIEFNWKYRDRVSGGGTNIRIPYRIRVALDSPITVRELDTTSIGSLLSGPKDTVISSIYWNFNLERWDASAGLQTGNKGKPVNGTMTFASPGDSNEWVTESTTVAPYNEYDGFFDYAAIPGGTMYVEIYYPQATSSGVLTFKNNVGDDTGRWRTLIDSIKVSDAFENMEEDPVYEHVAYTSAARDAVVASRTESYEPGFVSSGVNTFRQFLSSTSYWRTSETSSAATTLEEKVTLQKLNDFSSRFQYYEGSIVNLASEPLQLHNKLLISYTNAPNTVSCILNGGSFSPKYNNWDIFAYLPNQQVDLPFGRFFEYNVELVASLFEGRSRQSRYVLGLDVRGLDDAGVQHQTTDSEGRNPGDADYVPTNNSLVSTPPFIDISGLPGEFRDGIIRLNPGQGYEAAASNLSILGSDGNPFDNNNTPDYITFGDLTQSGSSVEIPFTVELPLRAEYEEVRIQGEVDPFIANNREYDLTFSLTGSTTGATIAIPNRVVRSSVGSSVLVDVFVSPAANQQLNATTFITQGALPTGVTLLGFSQFGTSVVASFSVEIQSVNSTGSITLSGAAATALPSGVSTSEVTLTLSESITNVSVSRTSLTVSGVVGTRSSYDVLCYAADGFTLDSDNFSVTESLAWIEMFDAVGGGESVAIPVDIIFPSSNQSGSIVINGSAQEIGAETVDITVNFTNSIANTSLTENSETFTLNPGQRINYVNTLSADSGYQILSGGVTISEVDTNNVINFTKGDAGRGAVNLSTSIVAPAANAMATVTLSGTATVEPYRFRIALDTGGLENAVTNQPSFISRPFGANDVGQTEIVQVQVAGTGNHAFTSTDTITVSSGASISTSSPTFSGGVWSFDATITYPANADSLTDIDSSIKVVGVAPATTISDNLFAVTLNFTDNVSFGAPAAPTVTLQGIPGTTANYDLMVIPDAGYRMPEANVTATEASAFVTIGNDDNRGLQTRVPISVTFQNTDEAATINVTGTGVAVGAVTTSTYALTVNPLGSNFTIPDWISANTLEGVGILPLNIDIQSNNGYSISGISSISAPTGVTVGSPTIIGDGAILPVSVDLDAANSGTLTFSVSTSQEPYLVTVSLSEDFPQAKLSTTSLTSRFGPDDYGTVMNMGTVELLPTEGLYAFTNVSQLILPSVSGLSFGSPTLANGRISFTVGASIPSNTTADLAYTANIGASLPVYSGANSIVPASTLVQYSSTNTFEGTATVFVPIVTNPIEGRFTVSGAGGVKQGNGVLITGALSAGVVDGQPFFTAQSRTVTVTHQDSGQSSSIRAVYRIDTMNDDSNSVSSPTVTSIDVNIGGTPGTSAGILYIT